MPNYDYRCETTGEIFEIFQGINDAPLPTCPKCGGPVKRLIGFLAAIQFKGTGFYKTDYKKKG